MKKIFLVTVVIFFCIPSMFAQELPKVIPPSPNTASLGQYADIPVSNYTGVPNISIPIYTINSGDINIPITLNYHSTGIKVAQEASWVGLGWALNAGGMISKQTRGKDDFGGNGYTSQSALPEADENNLVDHNSDTAQSYQYYSNINNDNIDAEPDIYSYNFLGYSGKLFFEKQSGDIITATPINQNNIIFEYNIMTKEWVVTDGNGWQYFFGTTEKHAVETTTNHSLTHLTRSLDYHYFPDYLVGSDLNPKTIDSAWYLTRILSNTGESVDFHYKTNPYKSLSQISFGETKYNLLDIIILDRTSLSINGPDNINTSLYSASQQEINDVYLERIEYNNGMVTFNTTDRDDISKASSGGTIQYYPQKLSNIVVSDQHNKLIQKTEFNFDYFSSNQNLRLKLDSIQNFNYLLESMPPYVFNYNSSLLPSKNSFRIDHWGYYNNKNNEYIKRFRFYDIKNYINSPNSFMVDFESNIFHKTLTPSYEESNASNSVSAFGANREPSPEFMQASILQSIENPLGYTQVFTYEPNDYSVDNHDFEEDNYVWQSVQTDDYYLDPDYDILTHGTFTIHETSVVNLRASVDYWGNATSVPINKLKIQLENSDYYDYPIIQFIPSSGYRDPDDSYTFYPSCKIVLPPGNYRLVTEVANDPNEDFLVGLSINYIEKLATEKKIGAGLRIKSIETYEDNTLQELQNKTMYNYEINGKSTGRLLSPKKYAYSNSMIETHFDPVVAGQVNFVNYLINYIVRSSNSLIPYGYSGNGSVIGYDQVSVSKENSNGDLLGTSIYQYRNEEEIPAEIFIPGVPNYIHLNNGQLLNEKHLNANNDIIKEKTINYTKDLNTINIKGIKVYKRFWESSTTPALDIRFYDLFSEWWYPSDETEIIYDVNGNNPITTTKNFEYANTVHKNLTKSTIYDSQERAVEIVNQYPSDYPSGTDISTSTFDGMVDNNILNPIIKQESQIGSTKLSEQTTTYNNFKGNYLPESIQTLKGESSTTNTLEPRVTYHDYDTKGNPLEVSKADGTHIVYIWGYHQSQPIAKIENATYSDVQSQVANLQSLSNADNDRTVDTINSNGTLTKVGKEGNLREALNTLRTSLPDAQVTTYTYDPLIGVTSITDPRGNTIYYEYDAFNRLKHVKDQDGHILSENDYHYRPQN